MRPFLAVALLLLGLGCVSEQPYRYYSEYHDAVTAGELARGWLPGWLPTSASDIHLQSDLDTSEIWLRCRLSTSVSAELRSQLRPLSEAEVTAAPWSRPRSASAWWPRNLVQQQPADDIALNAELFAAPPHRDTSEFIVAFSRVELEVFAWSRPR